VVKVLASHQCGWGSILAHMWLRLLLVLAFPRGFFAGYSGFLLPQKPTSPNSNLTRKLDPPAKVDVTSALNIGFIFCMKLCG